VTTTCDRPITVMMFVVITAIHQSPPATSKTTTPATAAAGTQYFRCRGYGALPSSETITAPRECSGLAHATSTTRTTISGTSSTSPVDGSQS